MRRIRLAVLAGIMAVGIAACAQQSTGTAAGTSGAASAAETSAAADASAEAKTTETEAAKETSAAEKDAAAETSAAEKDAAKETSAAENAEETSAAEDQKEDKEGTKAGGEKADSIYKDMDGIVFGFMSGVGAWETTLEVKPDGSFSGQFFDANMGETGEGYENGTIYECAFTGKFSEAEKVDETSYSAKVEKLDFETEKDGSSQYIEDETLYVMTEPYGLGLGDEIQIYLPGKKVSELSEGFMSWMNWKIPEDAEELDQTAIYNVTGDYVFYPDSFAMDVTEQAGEDTEVSSAYLAIKNAYYQQAMPDYYATPYVPVLDFEPEKPYQSVTLANLQGRWVNRYKEGGVEVMEVLSVNGDRARIETFMDGEQKGVWNGEGTASIEDRSDRNVCPAFRINDEDDMNLCTIYIRWVNSNAFYDGGFLNEWKREGNGEPDQYLYDTVTLENLQGVWYTEQTDADGLSQVVLTVNEDQALLFETIDGVPSNFWNGGGKASIVMKEYMAGVSYPELLIQNDHGPATGGGAGIYISSVGEHSFFDCGFNRWYVKVEPDFLKEEDEVAQNMTLNEDGSAEIRRSNHYVVRRAQGMPETGACMKWTVEVTNDEGMKETLTVPVDPDSIYIPDAMDIVSEEDVNFDGIPDVLLFGGVFGAHANGYYKCYLSDGKKLRRCLDYETIPNPYTDEASKQIVGTARDGAAAYYQMMYHISGDKVVKTEETRYVYDEDLEDYVPEKK